MEETKTYITAEMRRKMKKQFEKKQLSHARKQFKRAPYKYTPLEVKEVKNEQD